jgi:DNA-binding XRE family transcriptional regulator
MSAVAKTHHIKRGSMKGGALRLSFKRTTPRRIISEAQTKYAQYLIEDPDELIDISTTDWYKGMEKKMTPAKYLKTYRDILGYSQARLGELVGVPASRISDFENGQRAISKEMSKKLAELFKVSPALFI